MTRNIATSFVFPPIPWREWDWCAWYDGDEPDGMVGWGKPEADAINDLTGGLDNEPSEAP